MLFIFDWDGTILDSTGKIVRCMQAAIAEHNLPAVTDDQVLGIIGLGLAEAIRKLFPAIETERLVQVRDSYSRHFISADQTPCNFYPNVEPVLHRLRADGHQLAVATGKSRSGLRRVLANLDMDGFFDATRCADESASKPHPLMLHQLLDQLSVDVSQAIMVGDTDFDLKMANNAGMSSIAVSYGAQGVSRLMGCGPLGCIDDFSRLLDWVDYCEGRVPHKPISAL